MVPRPIPIYWFWWQCSCFGCEVPLANLVLQNSDMLNLMMFICPALYWKYFFLKSLVSKLKIVWLKLNLLNWKVIVMMMYGESMHVIRFWCQSHPTLSKKWHITVSNLGTVTCLKATFYCLFYILKIFLMVIFPLMSEIKRCHNLMIRKLTLHISWSSSLCFSTLLPYLFKKYCFI